MLQTKLLVISGVAAALALTGCGGDSGLHNPCVDESECLNGLECRDGACLPPIVLNDGGVDVFVSDGCTPMVEQCEPNHCGMVSNGCGGRLQCGGCEGLNWCGGGGVDNQCGCRAETDAEVCAAASLIECGSTSLTDRCGVERTVSCGTCTGAEQCGAFSHGTCDELACTASKWCRTLAPTLAGNFDIRSIWAGPSEAWAIASNWTTPYEARLLHFDGVNWKLATTSSLPLSAVSSVGGDVWLSSRDGDIYKWINGALVIAGTSPYDWSSIATISSSDIWVVGSSTSERARASHFDGGAWTAVEFGDVFDSPWRFLSVSAVAWNAVWAVGYDGDDGSSSDTAAPLVGFYDGLQWTRQSNVPTTAFLRSVWARSATDVWAVGDDGVIVHYDGQTWSASPSGVTHDLLAVTGVGNTVWAAGANGVLLKRAGSSWVLQQTGTTRTIRALGAISATDVWAGGDDGLLLHYKP